MRMGKLSTAGSLRPRLILIVGLALAPLALASIGQGFMRVDAHRQESVQRLRNIADYATWRERTVFPQAQRYLERLSAHPILKTRPADCERFLRDSMLGATHYVNVSRIGRDGTVRCSAHAAQPASSFAAAPWWPSMIRRHAFTVGPQPEPSYPRRGLVAAALPLYDDDGTFTGALSVAIDTKLLVSDLASGKLPENAILLLIDRNGAILAGSRPIDGETALAIARQAHRGVDGTFVTKAGAANKWRWVIQPAGNDGTIAAFGMQESWLMGITPVYIVIDIFLPLLMIVFAWGAIWLGTEWLVLHWTSYLHTLSIAYGRGAFDADVSELESAPHEFRKLGRAMMTMAKSVEARDQRLKQALFQEKSLAREIHHRVKNNLQIVSSLINIFGRQLTAPDAKRVLHQITTRVDALSLVHRLIEKGGQLPVVAMKPLLTELCEQFCATAEAEGEPCSVTLTVCNCQLPIDVVTPVALFTVEALSLASASGAGSVNLELDCDGDDRFVLVCTWQKSDVLLSGQILHSPLRIMSALAAQIGGTTWTEETPPARQQATLRFPRPTPLPPNRSNRQDDLGWGAIEPSMTGLVYEARDGEKQSDLAT